MKKAIAELIKAARGHAERLRRASFDDGDEFSQRMAQAEAKLWQQLADSAEQESAGLIVPWPVESDEP